MTRQEKLVIYFLIAMLFLGLAVKFYKAHNARINLKVEKASPVPKSQYLAGGGVSIEKIIEEKQFIKINTAAAGDFARLPGIGPSLAKRIIDYRDKNGSFVTIEDIKKVRGIGEKKYEQIKEFLVLE